MSAAVQMQPVQKGRLGKLRAGAVIDGVAKAFFVPWATAVLWEEGWLAIERTANDESWEPEGGAT